MSKIGVPDAARQAQKALGDARALPNLAWLAALLDLPREEIAEVLEELDSLLPVIQGIHDRLVEGGRSFYAQFRAPFELYAITRLLRPDHIIETGVSSGVSSAHYLLALQRNRRGYLHSIDLPTRQRDAKLRHGESVVSLPPGREPGWAVPPTLRRRWDLRLGPSQRLLPGLVAELPEVGIFFHDSLHTPSHLTFELTTADPKLAPGAVVLADNTSETGRAFDRFAAHQGVPVVRRGRSDLVGLRIPPNRR